MTQPLLQLGNTLVIVSRVEVRDLEVTLGDLHPLVELQRAHECRDGLLVQPLVVVEDAEVVVRTGVGRIDALGKRPEHIPVAVGRERWLANRRRGSGHRPG